MKDLMIITNNSMVKRKYNDLLAVNYCNDLNQVMVTTRDLIHKGFRLVSHPLAGSVKPVQNPYRSIIVKKGEELDYYSLEIIEKSMEKVKQFEKNHKIKNLTDSILEDYQVIDLSLIESGIDSL